MSRPRFSTKSLSGLSNIETKLILELNTIQRKFGREIHHVSVSYNDSGTRRFLALQGLVKKGIAKMTGKRGNTIGFSFSKEFRKWQQK